MKSLASRVDTRNVDMSIELFGERYDQPIFIAPVGGMGMFYPDAEMAVDELKAAGFFAIVVTNQPDVGAGLVDRSVVDANADLQEWELLCSRLLVVLFEGCPHR